MHLVTKTVSENHLSLLCNANMTIALAIQGANPLPARIRLVDFFPEARDQTSIMHSAQYQLLEESDSPDL